MSFDERFHEMSRQVRNWGRWGDDDRIGTLNFITDDVVSAAAANIRTGHRVSCAIDLENAGVQLGQVPTRVNPIHVMGSIDHPDLGDPDGDAMVPHFSDDMITMGLQAATHWDGLSHVSYGHQLYNGVTASSITARDGAGELGIEKIRHLVGRGVLLDIPASKGLNALPDDHEVTPDDLDAAAAWGGVEIKAGDIVLLRTGRIRLFFEQGAHAYTFGADGSGNNPGPGIDAVGWFHRHDIAAVAADSYIFEVFPGSSWDNALAVHCLHIVDMGLTQGQNWNLEPLSEACSAMNRHEFFLSASPEPVVGGCGAPVNPVAIF